MSESAPFRTIDEEVLRLLDEIKALKTQVREISSQLGRIDNRVKRAFPAVASRAKERDIERRKSHRRPASLTTEQVAKLYDDLVDLARHDRWGDVSERIEAISTPELQSIAQEMGVVLGNNPSRAVVISGVIGRIRESVLLSKHTTIETGR